MVLTALVCGLTAALSVSAADSVPSKPGDFWLTNHAQFPGVWAGHTPSVDRFETLHAEAVAGRLKLIWRPDRLATNAVVVAHASVSELSHWASRDWRPFPMQQRGQFLEAIVPVEDVDVPVAYFLSVVEASATNLSPLRAVTPRLAGLEDPSRIFWPVLEGFEEDLESWQLLTTGREGGQMKTDPACRHGQAALAVSLPPGKRSITVATTRVKGWQAVSQKARGVRVWLRTRQGEGRARFTLLANAHSTNQVVVTSRTEARLNDQWQKVDLFFDDFPALALVDVDLFAIEFIGEGPRDFLLDDLELIGPWRMLP